MPKRKPFHIFFNINPSVPGTARAHPLPGNGSHAHPRIYITRTAVALHIHIEDVHEVRHNVLNRIIQKDRMHPAVPSLLRTVQRNPLVVELKGKNDVHITISSSIRPHIHNHLPKELCVVSFRRGKFHRDDPHLHTPYRKCRSIRKCMDPEPSAFLIRPKLVHEPGNVLVILTLCLCEPRILSHAFNRLPAADLHAAGRHARVLALIRLASAKCQHIPHIDRRISNRIRVKWHIIDHSKVSQYVPADLLPCRFQPELDERIDSKVHGQAVVRIQRIILRNERPHVR